MGYRQLLQPEEKGPPLHVVLHVFALLFTHLSSSVMKDLFLCRKKKKKAWWNEDLLASKNFLEEDVYAHKIYPAYFSTIWTKREKNTLPEREKVAETPDKH